MLYLALKEYESLFINQKVIVIGDFNVDYNLKGSYSGIGGFLFNDLKISSCYHHFYHKDFGQESRATHFHQRKSQLPFHIDYCFVSRSILEDIKEIHIGKSKDWIEVSDHFPLILEIGKDNLRRYFSMTQNEVIIGALEALGGEGTIKEVSAWMDEMYPNRWKDYGTVLADMVPVLSWWK
jgi:hypothetical protein